MQGDKGLRCIWLPGRNFVAGMFLLALLSFCAFLWDGAGVVLWGAALLLLGFAAADFWRLRGRCAKIRATRETVEIVGRGNPFQVNLSVENKSGKDFFIRLREMLPAVCGGERLFDDRSLASENSLQLDYPLTFSQRGSYEIGGLWARLRSGWNLVAVQWQILSGHELKVYPESIAPGGEFRHIQSDQPTEKIHNIHKRGDGMEFDSLVPFSAGDDVRHIDWRASARQRNLLVRRHQVEQHRDVFILLDCGRLMGADAGCGSKLDRAVDAGLLLSQVALRRGDRCGFAVFDDKVQYYQPPAAGMIAGRQIIQHVYALNSEFRESNFSQIFSMLQSRQLKRSLIVVISDIAGDSSSEIFRSALLALTRRHAVVFAALRTPLLGEYIQAESAGYNEICAKAVCLKLERERYKALHSLGNTGVTVLDVLPENLNAPLINTYLDVRESGRL